ncbi:hypothetical protein EAH86_19840 [Pedococcus bigeumensis]|uniref:Uncharacterized protein n=1 Tax=Pedococcus bigeumensis TaxID=433644 RepID=A0A502CKB7_9MICO|nr:hypothetical protein EAH86_19840 [Pedococcus bigeumensis]
MISVSDGIALVNANGGEVPAFVTDHTGLVAVGNIVTISPLGETYELTSIRSGGTPAGLVLGSNLLPNPGFEYGPAGAPPDNWTEYTTTANAVLVWDNTAGESLAGSARALVTMTPDVVPVDHTTASRPVMVDDGIDYQGSVWLKAVGTATAWACVLKVLTAPDAAKCEPGDPAATETTLATVTSPGGAYQLALGPITVPATHGYARLLLQTTADAGAVMVVSWDEAALQQKVTP